MSRYLSESAARFDQQFRETEYERNARLRQKREAHTRSMKLSQMMNDNVAILNGELMEDW